MTSRFFHPAAKRARSSSEGPEGAGQQQRRSASLPSSAEAPEVHGWDLMYVLSFSLDLPAMLGAVKYSPSHPATKPQQLSATCT